MIVGQKNPLIILFTLLVGEKWFWGKRSRHLRENYPFSYYDLLLHYDKSNSLQERSPLVIFLLTVLYCIVFGCMHWCRLRRLLCTVCCLYTLMETNSLLLNTEKLLTRLTSVLSIFFFKYTVLSQNNIANYLRIISNYTIYCTGRPKLK